MLSEKLNETIDRQQWLENAANTLQPALENAFNNAGKAGKALESLLQGEWLGHPLHPALTDVPLGAWTMTALLDLLDTGEEQSRLADAADICLLVGLIGAGGAAITGIMDWKKTKGVSRKTGVLHAALNTAASSLYIGSLVSRKKGNRGLGKALAFAGYSIGNISAFLGGHMVFTDGVGVKAEEQSAEEVSPPCLAGIVQADNTSSEDTLDKTDVISSD